MVTSKHLPIVSSFLEFWDAHMTSDTDDDLDELELEEVCALFKGSCERGNTHASVSETEIMSLIQHFFPNVSVTDGKLLANIKCDAWDKQECIAAFLADQKGAAGSSKVTLNKLYKLYCKVQNGKALICSKSYFERVIRERFKENLVSKWCLKDCTGN